MTRRIAIMACLLAAFVPACLAVDETKLPDGDSSNDGGTSCNTDAYLTLNDDPAGGDWCTADSNNVNWAFVFTMEDPSGALDTGADVQAIRFYVQSFDEGQGGDPTIQVNIYDGTSCADLHESGTVTTLTDAGFPAEVTENWTAAGLSSENDVCVQVNCVKSGGSPGNRNSCNIDNVVWDVTLGAAGGRTRRAF